MARFTYGYFGAITPVPGIYSISVYVKVGTAMKGFPGRVHYDSTISVPTLKWTVSSFGLATSADIYYPTGYNVSSAPLNLTATDWPKNGEVIQLPGLSAPVAAPAPIPLRLTPAPVPVVDPVPVVAPAPAAPLPVVDTGKTTIIDTPVGPTPVKVVEAPVPAPMLISPKPGAAPVMVVPQQSNLPTMPTRMQPRAPMLVDDDSGFPPGMYNRETYFPPEIFPRRVPQAGVVSGGARRAMTAAADEEFDVTDIFIGGGRADEEGRPYPNTTPVRILPTAPPSRSGFVPTAPARPRVVDVRPETDGTVLVRVPATGTAKSLPPPLPPPLPQAGGVGVVGLAAGAGAGFVVAGPVGAAVGLVGAFLLGKKG